MNTKTMIAIAALCGAVAVNAKADGIVSSNIVGYNVKTTDGTKYPLFGACFLPLGGAETFKLGDFVPSNISADDDNLQVINSTTLDADYMFLYIDKETADYIAIDNGGVAGDCDDLIGWWDGAYDIGDEDGYANDKTFDNGTGFLGFFESGNEIGFTSSGVAPQNVTSITTDGTKYPVIANYIPRAIPFKYIVPSNISADDDNLQVINSTTLDADYMFLYIDKDTADYIAVDNGGEPGDCDELIGWWDGAYDIGEEEGSVDNKTINPGDAFLGFLESGNEITFSFPSSTANLE